VHGCTIVCDNQSQLYNHVRNIHHIVDSSSVDLPYFIMLGQPINIPPYRPPHYLPLRFCPIHTLPYGSCSICVDIDAMKDGPKPPYRLFNQVSIDFKLKQAIITKGFHSLVHVPTNLKVNKHQEVVIINSSEAQVGVVITLDSGLNKTHNEINTNTTSNNHGKHSSHTNTTTTTTTTTSSNKMSTIELKGRPVAMITDRYDIGWLAVEILFTYRNAIDRGIILPDTFNKRYQIYRPLYKYVQVNVETREINFQELEIFDENGENAMRKYIKWVRFSQIERTFVLKMVDSEIEMNHIIQNTSKSALKKIMFMVNNINDV